MDSSYQSDLDENKVKFFKGIRDYYSQANENLKAKDNLGLKKSVNLLDLRAADREDMPAAANVTDSKLLSKQRE